MTDPRPTPGTPTAPGRRAPESLAEPAYESSSTESASTSSGESRRERAPRYRRRKWLPLILFVLTCASTYFVGMTQWSPISALAECTPLFDDGQANWSATSNAGWTLMPLRRMWLSHWDDGLLYMILVMSILLAHEMGHFIATIIYRIPATYPTFIPFPFNPLGTWGAVIGMQGSLADRKQIFDIGIAGPIAGLVIAVPVMWWGVVQLDLTPYPSGTVAFQCPVSVQWMLEKIKPSGFDGQTYVWISQLNPFFAAGWVGFLVTGINMLPISQLDGGHVTYSMFGRAAHWIARITMTVAIALMVFASAPTMILMVLLLLVMGTDHPPTSDDRVPLGVFRYALGIASLAIPLLCFPPLILKW